MGKKHRKHKKAWYETRWWKENGVPLSLGVVIIILSILGFIFTKDNRWSAPLVGCTALIAVYAVMVSNRMRSAMDKTQKENKLMRLAMQASVEENQLMREFTQKVRTQDATPNILMDWIDYWVEGKSKSAIAFRNAGPGIAKLRSVQFTDTRTDNETKEVTVITFPHSFDEILIWPRQTLHTEFRGQAWGGALSGYESVYAVHAKIFNIYDEYVSDYSRTFTVTSSDVFADPERGAAIGEWMDGKGSYGFLQ